MSNARLENILKQVREMQVKSDERAEVTGENFNVFSILDRERKEVTTHSAIIAELLNPHGSHSQRTLFLKLFLKQLEPAIDVSNGHSEFKVRTEEFVFHPEKKEKGFLDIVIESVDAYIVIENKIDTKDTEGQLEKYCKHIKKIKKDTKVLLYLTPEGEGPTAKKLILCGKGPVYKLKDFPFPLMCLSYKDFIDEWLDACIKEVARIPQIGETLHQYQMTVRKLTGKLTGKLPPEVEEILDEKKDLKEGVITDLQYEFFKELKEQLADKNPKFQLYNDLGQDKEILDDAELKKSICHRHPSLGLTFSIPNSLPDPSYDKHEVAFRVFYERAQVHSYFTYGFVFRRKDTLQREKIKEHRGLEQYTRLRYQNEEEKDDGWISWTYFRYEPGDFIPESKETLTRKLISEINLALSKAGVMT